ncbi:MAG: hypothetical protein QW575_07955 [Thermoproteota archaeon]
MKLLLAGKDAVATYFEDNEKYKNEPIFLHRRFIGSVFSLIGIALGIAGINWINIHTVEQAYWQIVPAIMTLYGMWLAHKGIKDKNNIRRKIAIHKALQKDDEIGELIRRLDE